MFIDFQHPDYRIEGMDGIKVPDVCLIRQIYDSQSLADPLKELKSKLDKVLAGKKELGGKRIAITAGSRGIPLYVDLLRCIGEELKTHGAKPFVVPAMGSHGGATAEGQAAILSEYGISEESIGMPIISSMETIQYGMIGDVPLYCDKAAFESDGIVVFNKVKPHTDFRGPIESGLCKMMAIGLGKHRGASALHQKGFDHFATLIPQVGEALIETNRVLCGIGLVQNAYDEICCIDTSTGYGIVEMDERLQKLAKIKIPRFKFKAVDVLVIEQIGKNISGSGFDPNIIGRIYSKDPGFSDILDLKKLVICGLTPQSSHNGVGIALADVATRRCLRDIDWGVLWTNSITSTEMSNGRIPVYADSDYEAIRLAIRTSNDVDRDNIRLAKIHNTMRMNEIEVSKALFHDIENRDDVEKLSDFHPMAFDAEGNIPGLY